MQDLWQANKLSDMAIGYLTNHVEGDSLKRDLSVEWDDTYVTLFVLNKIKAHVDGAIEQVESFREHTNDG